MLLLSYKYNKTKGTRKDSMSNSYALRIALTMFHGVNQFNLLGVHILFRGSDPGLYWVRPRSILGQTPVYAVCPFGPVLPFRPGLALSARSCPCPPVLLPISSIILPIISAIITFSVHRYLVQYCAKNSAP